MDCRHSEGGLGLGDFARGDLARGDFARKETPARSLKLFAPRLRFRPRRFRPTPAMCPLIHPLKEKPSKWDDEWYSWPDDCEQYTVEMYGNFE